MFYGNSEKKTLKEETNKNKKKPKKRLNRWSIFGIVAFTAFITLVYVGNVVQINALLKEVRDSENNYSLLKSENEELKLKLNNIQSPDKIVSIAESKLGMARTDRPPIILKNK
jgi:cell division protein FtsL